MTAKEAYERLVKKISISTDEDTWNLLTEDTKYPLKQLEEYEVVLKALNELDELKRDVKRYFELDEYAYWEELYDLELRLKKVGNEE